MAANDKHEKKVAPGAVLPDQYADLYKYTKENAPDDLVVNAGVQPIIVQATARCPEDNTRINVGDRRQGRYYINLSRQPAGVALARVKDLPEKRLLELEKIRMIRTGEREPDWVREVWAKKGKEPGQVSGDKDTLLDRVGRAAAGTLD